MSNGIGKSGPYHRTGEPGGPGCAVESQPITLKAQDGSAIPAYLLDAGTAASELELLRTIASGMGIRWGHDDGGAVGLSCDRPDLSIPIQGVT